MDKWPKISLAARNGDLESIKRLISSSSANVDDVDARGFTPLMIALENLEATETVRQLILDYGANVDHSSVS